MCYVQIWSKVYGLFQLCFSVTYVFMKCVIVLNISKNIFYFKYVLIFSTCDASLRSGGKQVMNPEIMLKVCQHLASLSIYIEERKATGFRIQGSGFRIQDFFIFNTTQHNELIKSTTQFNKGVRNKPTILAKMKIGKLTKTRCLCYLTH